MKKKSFVIIFVIIILSVVSSFSIANYFSVEESVLSYLPKDWSPPIEISSGDIHKTFSVSTFNNTYLLSYVEGDSLVIEHISSNGKKINKNSFPLKRTYIENLSCVYYDDFIYITYNYDIDDHTSFVSMKLNFDLSFVSENIISHIYGTAKLNDTLYAVANAHSIELIDISSHEDTDIVLFNSIEELQHLYINDNHVLVFKSPDYNYYYTVYKNGKFSPKELIVSLDTSLSDRYENLRLSSSEDDLILLVDKYNYNNFYLNTFVYKYSFGSFGPLGKENFIDSYDNENTEKDSQYISKKNMINTHPSISYLSHADNSISLRSNSKDLVGLTLDDDGNVINEELICAFADNADFYYILPNELFYLRSNGPVNKSIMMISQNEDLLRDPTVVTDYEKQYIIDIFSIKIGMSLFFVFVASFTLGGIALLLLTIHFFICSRFPFNKKIEFPLLIGVLVLAFIIKLPLLYELFYSISSNNAHLPYVFKPTLSGLVFNLSISLAMILACVFLYKKNKNIIYYNEVFMLMMSDFLLSLYVFLPFIVSL